MASLNKQALLRYRIIDKLISERNYPTMQDIINLCEERLGKRFSENTIQKDIETMKNDLSLGYEAPIHFERKYMGYEYTDKEFSLQKVNLTDKEFDILESTLDILSQFKGTQFSENYKTAIDKVSTAIRQEKENRKNPIISLTPQSEYVGMSDIDNFITYIKERTPLSIVYAKNNDFSGDFIHPYMLKEYKSRWYVIAYSEILERIEAFDIRYLYDIYQLTKRKFIDKNFDADSYFKDSLGIGIIEGLKEKVQIEFSKLVYDEVNSIPIHSSQKIIRFKANGDFIVEVEIYVTNEFFNEIMSFGSSAKVLKPQWAVGMMKCIILNMYHNYKVDNNDCRKKYKMGKGNGNSKNTNNKR